MSGKGSNPRPFDVPREVYESNHARIFGERKKKQEPVPPFAAPASQQDAGASVLTDAQIEELAKTYGASMVSPFTHPEGPVLSYQFKIGNGALHAFGRAIEAEVTRLCRAQRRSNNPSEE